MNEYVLKYTSYKTLKCYKLVFSFKHFIKNIGSIIVLILFVIYLGFFVYFLLRGISPLKLAISKIFFEDQSNKPISFENLNIKKKSKPKNKKKKALSSNGDNPPKKVIGKSLFNKNDNNISNHNNKNNIILFSDIEEEDNNDKKNANINTALFDKELQSNILYKNSSNIKTNSVNSSRNNYINNENSTNNNSVRKNIIISGRGPKSYFHDFNLAKKNDKKSKFAKDKDKSVNSDKDKKKIKRKINGSIQEKSHKKFKSKEILDSSSSFVEKPEDDKKLKMLDDYELNHLGYFDALQEDKRNFCRIYCSLIKRDHIIFSACSCNDYNLFYVKMAKFIFILCTLMTMNVYFFSDKSFHKLFISGVKYYFSYQILKIIISVLITLFVEVILCYLTMTDRHVYEIKSLPKNENQGEKVVNILKCLTNKLIIFFATTISIFLFYWYSISAFCAVYPNSQLIYIIDCLLSCIFFAIIPFISYALLTLLRVISLKDDDKKRLKCIYKLSQCFPVF